MTPAEHHCCHYTQPGTNHDVRVFQSWNKNSKQKSEKKGEKLKEKARQKTVMINFNEVHIFL